VRAFVAAMTIQNGKKSAFLHGRRKQAIFLVAAVPFMGVGLDFLELQGHSD
jgi:hypothetical protein